jgi:hypothetical protein
VKHVSIGPLKFGMGRPEVAKAVGSKATPFKKTPEATVTTDEFKVGPHRVHVFYTAEDRCAYVEVFGEGVGGPEYDGRGFLNRPYDRALAWMRERDPNLVVEDAGCRSDALGLSLSAPDGPESKIKTVGAASENYWSQS